MVIEDDRGQEQDIALPLGAGEHGPAAVLAARSRRRRCPFRRIDHRQEIGIVDGEQDMGSDERVLDGGTRVGGRCRRVLHRDPEPPQRPVGRPGRGARLCPAACPGAATCAASRRTSPRSSRRRRTSRPAMAPAESSTGSMSSFAGTFTGARHARGKLAEAVRPEGDLLIRCLVPAKPPGGADGEFVDGRESAVIRAFGGPSLEVQEAQVHVDPGRGSRLEEAIRCHVRLLRRHRIQPRPAARARRTASGPGSWRTRRGRGTGGIPRRGRRRRRRGPG